MRNDSDPSKWMHTVVVLIGLSAGAQREKQRQRAGTKKKRERREREERAAAFERRAAVTGKHGDTIPTIPSLVIPKG